MLSSSRIPTKKLLSCPVLGAPLPAPVLNSLTVAILCPGPSLVDDWWSNDRDDYDVIIGVNRAVLFERCHIWAAGDDFTVTRVLRAAGSTIAGKPKILTRYCAHVKMRNTLAPDPLPFEVIEIDKTREQFKRSVPPRCFSYSATMSVCYSFFVIKASRVDVYGSQLQGTADFDGGQDPDTEERRNDGRWHIERKLWKALHDTFKEKLVNRCRSRSTQTAK